MLGVGVVGTHAGDKIGEIGLAIDMGADAVDIVETVQPHPTLGESIGMVAEVAHGSCTDLPPAKMQAAPAFQNMARTGNGSGIVLVLPRLPQQGLGGLPL